MEELEQEIGVSFEFSLNDLATLPEEGFNLALKRLAILNSVMDGGEPPEVKSAKIVDVPTKKTSGRRTAKQNREDLPNARPNAEKMEASREFIQKARVFIDKLGDKEVNDLFDIMNLESKTTVARRLSAIPEDRYEEVLAELEARTNEEESQDDSEEETGTTATDGEEITFDSIKEALATYQEEHGKEAGIEILKEHKITSKKLFESASVEARVTLLEALM